MRNLVFGVVVCLAGNAWHSLLGAISCACAAGRTDNDIEKVLEIYTLGSSIVASN